VISRALRKLYPLGTEDTWTDDTGTFHGLTLPDGSHVVETVLSRVATAEELAAAAAEAVRVGKIAALKDDVSAVLAELKAGTLTFGTAARDNAAKKLARGLRFVLKGEIDE
jgi:hypothetical protein